MTKEQFLDKWRFGSNPLFEADLEAVIATEIAKAKEPQTSFNPIAEAYERGEKIRHKDWLEGDWILKYDEIKCISRNRLIQSFKLFSQKINTSPEKWQIYTEPAEQPTKPFDKERFEAMFRAVVASGRTERWEQDFKFSEEALAKLDAYYASKEGGNNGI